MTTMLEDLDRALRRTERSSCLLRLPAVRAIAAQAWHEGRASASQGIKNCPYRDSESKED